MTTGISRRTRARFAFNDPSAALIASQLLAVRSFWRQSHTPRRANHLAETTTACRKPGKRDTRAKLVARSYMALRYCRGCAPRLAAPHSAGGSAKGGTHHG